MIGIAFDMPSPIWEPVAPRTCRPCETSYNSLRSLISIFQRIPLREIYNHYFNRCIEIHRCDSVTSGAQPQLCSMKWLSGPMWCHTTPHSSMLDIHTGAPLHEEQRLLSSPQIRKTQRLANQLSTQLQLIKVLFRVNTIKINFLLLVFL